MFPTCRTILLLAAVSPIFAQNPDGAALYKRDCAVCHDGGNPRAPSPEAIRERSPEAVLEALNGIMRIPGSRLNAIERRAVAEYLTGKELGGDVSGASTGRCPTQPPFRDPSSGPAWNGWSPDLTHTVFQSARAAGLTPAQLPNLKLKWAFGFPDANSAWGGITVVSGRLFTGSQNGTVYSLDAKTGCVYWTFSAVGGVRTPITIAPREGNNRFTAYFGDNSAFAYAVDAFTGEKLWSRKIEDHPVARITGQMVFYDGRLYVPMASYEETMGASTNYECCTFRGSLTALDPKTGETIWKTYTISEQPKPRSKNKAGGQFWGPGGAAIWSAPTIDSKRGRIYVGTGNCYSGPYQPTCDAVVAFDIKTGKIVWSAQPLTDKDVSIAGCGARAQSAYCPEGEDESGPDFDFGNPAILTKTPKGRDVIVIGQKSGIGFALDPDAQGKVIWQYRAGEGSANGGMEWGSATDAEHAYFPVADNYRSKPGGLHAVDLGTGERVWFTPAPPPKCGEGRFCNGAQAAAISVVPGIVFSGSNDGAMRAYSTKDGSILWEYDTNHEFETVNGVPAKGASIVGAPPLVVGGMLYFNSGYGTHGGRPGNVLLAFGVD